MAEQKRLKLKHAGFSIPYDPSMSKEQILGVVRRISPKDFQAYLRTVEPETQIPEPTFTESVGRGMADVTQGVTQLGKMAFGRPDETEAYTTEKAKERALYEEGQGEGFDIGRVLGSTAMFALPGAGAATLAPRAVAGLNAASLVPRAATGAAVGAASGATEFAETGRERAMSAGIGALGGGVGGAATPWASALMGKAARSVMGAPAPPPEVAGYIDWTRRNFPDAPPPTYGQAAKDTDPTIFATEKDIKQQTPVLGDQYRAQHEFLEGMVREPMRTPSRSGGEVVSHMRTWAEDARTYTKQLYDAVDQIDPGVVMPYGALYRKVDELTDTHDMTRFFSKNPGVKERLDDIASGKRIPNASELQKLDKLLSQVPMKDRATNHIVRNLKDSLEQVLDDAASRAPGLAPAYQAAKNQAYETHVMTAPKNIRNILSGDMAPEDIIRKGVVASNMSIRDVDALMRIAKLDPSGKAQANLRDAMDGWIYNRSRAGKGSNELSWKNTVEAIQHAGPEKLRIIYGDAEAEKLLDTVKLARLYFDVPGQIRPDVAKPSKELDRYLDTYVGQQAGIAGRLWRWYRGSGPAKERELRETYGRAVVRGEEPRRQMPRLGDPQKMRSADVMGPIFAGQAAEEITEDRM